MEIRKDNSEQQLKTLQQELEQYGIQMQIEQLTYRPDGTIKRFKGQFDTDSLFCGEAIHAQTFDVSGNFQSMSFTFRVAESNNQLKYLKIAMDDEVEQTIECYDDEILSDANEARRLYNRAKNERFLALRSASRAERDLARMQAEIARVKSHYVRIKADSIAHIWFRQTDSFPQILERFHNNHSVEYLLDSLRPGIAFEYWDWGDGEGVDTALLFQQLRGYENRLRFELKNWELDQKNDALILLKEQIEHPILRNIEILEGDLEDLIDLKDIVDIEEEVEVALALSMERSNAAQLEQEAKRLEKEAKLLQKLAKQKAKEAKRRAKEAKRRAKERARSDKSR